MCQRVTCKSCGKPSYTGCGRHIEAVLGDVPPEARCRCRELKAQGRSAAGRSGWLSSLWNKASGGRS